MRKIDTKKHDEALMIGLREGKKEAFDIIYSSFWEDLYTFAYKATSSTEDAEELVQDLFVDVWFRREQIEIRDSLRGYLFTALKYKLLDKIRKERRFEEFTNYIIGNLFQFADENPEKDLIVEESKQLIMDKINTLPEKCREIFILRKLENYSITEIAEKLFISPQTVKNQLTKATQLIRPYYEEILVSTISVLFLNTL